MCERKPSAVPGVVGNVGVPLALLGRPLFAWSVSAAAEPGVARGCPGGRRLVEREHGLCLRPSRHGARRDPTRDSVPWARLGAKELPGVVAQMGAQGNSRAADKMIQMGQGTSAVRNDLL